MIITVIVDSISRSTTHCQSPEQESNVTTLLYQASNDTSRINCLCIWPFSSLKFIGTLGCTSAPLPNEDTV